MPVDAMGTGGRPRIFRIPMRLTFRGVTYREGALLQGPLGWGEFSPFPEYGPAFLARWLAAAREATTRVWPAPVRTRVPVNTTIPAVGAEQAHALAAASGCRTAKVKVGDGDDEARVEAVRDALGPGGRIRLDVNGAWDVDEAARRIRALGRYGLEYVEQPVPTVEEMGRLRRLVDVPLAADESVRLADDPRRVALGDAADVVVLKVQPLGGVWAALEVAEALTLPAVVSSAVETSVGIAAGLALAAALPELPFACGLGTVPLLEGDVVDAPLLPVGGELELRRPPVSEAALAPYERSGAEAASVLTRLEAAMTHSHAFRR
jgi:o-succinylbenzoate synthase